jgi:hypothetical protein
MPRKEYLLSSSFKDRNIATPNQSKNLYLSKPIGIAIEENISSYFWYGDSSGQRGT